MLIGALFFAPLNIPKLTGGELPLRLLILWTSWLVIDGLTWVPDGHLVLGSFVFMLPLVLQAVGSRLIDEDDPGDGFQP